jgi:hypothetical protein
MLQFLDADPGMYIIRTGNLANGQVGDVDIHYTIDASGAPLAIVGAVITIDPSNYAAEAARLQLPVTNVPVIGHEVGHVWGGIHLWGLGMHSPRACGETCAVRIENRVRQEAGMQLRP